MTLEERLVRRKPIVITKRPSAQALEQVRSGSKFVIVEDDFPDSSVPDGYTLIRMKFKGDTFKTLIPQNLLFFMANPGEGDPENGLEEIADFYGDVKDFEEDQMGNGDTSVQGANWANLARGSYHTYLINKLVRGRILQRDENGDPVPEFNNEVLKQLDVKDDYVAQRIKAIAAISLGKRLEDIRAHEVRDLLKHVTVSTEIHRETIREKLTREEFDKVACYAGSHYELKAQYKLFGKGGWRYEIEKDFDRRHKVGYRVKEVEEVIEKKKAVLDARIGELEREIHDYRAGKHPNSIGRHDAALLRQYINLSMIAHENPQAQLDIMPPEKESNGKDAEGEKK